MGGFSPTADIRRDAFAEPDTQPPESTDPACGAYVALDGTTGCDIDPGDLRDSISTQRPERPRRLGHPDRGFGTGARCKTFWLRPDTARRASGRAGRVLAGWRRKAVSPDAVMYEMKACDQKAEKVDDRSEGRQSAARIQDPR
jgi:hypothetical protein